jgi:hypothetical protein
MRFKRERAGGQEGSLPVVVIETALLLLDCHRLAGSGQQQMGWERAAAKKEARERPKAEAGTGRRAR